MPVLNGRCDKPEHVHVALSKSTSELFGQGFPSFKSREVTGTNDAPAMPIFLRKERRPTTPVSRELIASFVGGGNCVSNDTEYDERERNTMSNSAFDDDRRANA
jgi:hypothetical protein